MDALCRRFEIDNTHRTLHGALLDRSSPSLYQLLGGRQPGLLLDADQDSKSKMSRGEAFENLHFQIDANNIRPIRLHAPTEDELRAHAEFVASLKDPVWNQ